MVRPAGAPCSPLVNLVDLVTASSLTAARAVPRGVNTPVRGATSLKKFRRSASCSRYRIPPHTHPKTERVTVISGTFNIGMGAEFDQTMTKPVAAETFGYRETGMKHFVWIKGEAVVQFHGMGSWSIQYVDPQDDPRNQKSKGTAMRASRPRNRNGTGEDRRGRVAKA